MRKNQLVSIIINNYNYSCFLNSAINSALKQTYPNTEVIVVDDGSTDASPNIILEYGNKIIAILKENGGQASAFNVGFTVSKGDIIVFLDSDDELLPNAIEEVVKEFDGSEVVKVHWPMFEIDGTGKRTGKIEPKYPLASGDLRESVILYGPNYSGGPPNSPPTSGNAWSRHFLTQVFPLSEAEYKAGGNDYYLSVLAPVFGTLKSITKPLGLYRIHGTNHTLKPLDEYLNVFFSWFEHSCLALSVCLRNRGIEVEPGSWLRDTWYHKVHTALNEINIVLPSSASFIFIDWNNSGTGHTIAGRHRIHFLERHGNYWGMPADDAEAISEVERQRGKGVSFMIFAWPAFWWLEYYSELNNFLRTNFSCVLENERLLIFNLGSN